MLYANLFDLRSVLGSTLAFTMLEGIASWLLLKDASHFSMKETLPVALRLWLLARDESDLESCIGAVVCWVVDRVLAPRTSSRIKEKRSPGQFGFGRNRLGVVQQSQMFERLEIQKFHVAHWERPSINRKAFPLSHKSARQSSICLTSMQVDVSSHFQLNYITPFLPFQVRSSEVRKECRSAGRRFAESALPGYISET